MRFAWKMIALVSVLLALSLAVGGLAAVQSAFRSELDAAVSEAQEDMKLFGITLQALCLVENDRQAPEDTLRRVLESYPVFSAGNYYVYDADGLPLAGTGEAHPEELTDRDVGMIETRIVRRGTQYEVLSTQRLMLLGRGFALSRSRDVTGVVRRAEADLGRYELFMLAILLAGILLTTLLTLWMTRPIRRIARGTKQLSDGRYDRRVNVQTDDELGQLAQEFNRMADALEEKIHELEDAAQRQKDFTASFAHELKTPLTSVIGYADTLRSRVLPKKQQMEAANYIFSEGKRLEAMSFALLDLFALERETPQLQEVQAAQLVRELQLSADGLLRENGMALSAEAEPGTLTCAPELVKTLLYNLIDNARKASKPGDRIELRGCSFDRGYRFTVTDRGSGIPQEALSRLTEPFYMVDKSRARAKGGAGLGLALCQKIVELHGGSLRFESAEGEGTAVTVEIGGGQA